MTAFLETLGGVLLTLAVHATVLLSLVWLAERARLLRHPGWAELAWRGALFGALLSTAVALLPWSELPRPEVSPALAAALAPTPVTLSPTVAPAPRTHTVALPQAIRSESAPLSLSTLSVEATRAPVLPVPPRALQALLALWLSGLALGVAWRWRQWRGLRGLATATAQRGRPASPALARLATEVAQGFDRESPALVVLAGADSPMILPDRRVLLPAWCEGLDRDQQRALLAHELAHLERADPAWRVAQHLALLPLFFHPLAWLARARLEALSEDACDARAAALVGSGRPLAECLAECLSRAPARSLPRWSVAMAGQPGPVVRRVQKLIEENPMKFPALSPAWRVVAVVAGLFVLVALPGIAVVARDVGLGTSISLHEDDAGQRLKASYRGTDQRLRAEAEGRFTANADESDLASLDDGGELWIEETRAGVTRDIRFRGVSGKIDRVYRVAGKEQPLDAAGRAWLATALPDLYRLTGLHAETRGKRLLAAGGPSRLMAEIRLLRTDHARAQYLGVLFRHGPLEPAALTEALALSEAIDSDFELRRALSVAVAGQPMTPVHQAQWLAHADRLGSDFERAELLTAGLERLGLSATTLPAWRKALDGISSDFERKRTLVALLKRGQPAAVALPLALESAHGIGSDFEARSVLEAAAPLTRGQAGSLGAYLGVVGQLSSDFEARQALQALITTSGNQAATARGVLAALDDMGSDFEVREVLVELAAVMPADQALIEQYRGVARGLGDFERGQAEKALDRFAIAQVD